MGANTKEKISNDPGMTEPQDSNDLGNTSSQSSELVLELEKDYILNPKTGEKLTGNDLRTLANQGKITRDLQSKHDKMQDEHKLALQRLAELEKENQELFVKATVSETLKSSKSKKVDQEESEDILSDWLGAEDEEDEEKPVKPVNRYNREKPSQNDDLKEVRDEINQIKEAERMRTAEQERQEVDRLLQNMDYVELKKDLPDISDQELTDIIRTEQMEKQLDRQADEIRTQRQPGWNEVYAERVAEKREMGKKAIKMRMEAYRKQESHALRRDTETFIEGASPISGPPSIPEGLVVDTNPEVSDRSWKDYMARELEKERGRRRLRVP